MVAIMEGLTILNLSTSNDIQVTIFLWFSSCSRAQRKFHNTKDPVLVVFSSGNIVFLSKSWLSSGEGETTDKSLASSLRTSSLGWTAFTFPGEGLGAILGKSLTIFD